MLVGVGMGWLGTPAADGAASAFSPVSGSPFATGSEPFSVAFSPGGGLLATANNTDNTVSVFDVGSGGALTPVTGSPFATGSGPQSVAFSPSRRLLATANTNDNTVSVFAVGATGALSQVTGSPFATGSGPDSVAFSAGGELLATADSSADAVSVFDVASGGSLTPVAGSPFAAGGTPQSVAFGPGGGLLATANPFDNTLSVFDVASGGALTPVAGSPFATGRFPTSVAFSPGGGLLADPNKGDYTVSVFALGSGGTLPPVTGSPFGTGSEPFSVAFSRDGGLLATANVSDNTVSVFSVGPPSARIASPAGRRVYTVGRTVATSFSCVDAAAAPGIRKCRDSNGSLSPGRLETTHPGTHTYTVTAISKDGQRATRSITYTVVAVTPGAVNLSGSSAQVFLSCPSQPASGCQATLTLKTTNPADSVHIVTAGQAKATLAAGQGKTITLELNDRGKQLLRKRGRLQTTLMVTQAGTTVAHRILTFGRT